MSSLCDIIKKKLLSKYSTKMLDFKRQSSTYLYLNKKPYNYWFDIFYWFNMQFFYFCSTIFCQISSRRVSKQGNIKHRMIWVIRKKLSKVTIVGKSSWSSSKLKGTRWKRNNNSLNKHIFKHINQAWRRRNRQERGHHSPSFIQGEWLAIDDQKITF